MITVKRLSLAEAHVLLMGARQRANHISMPMCIAITDESGNLIAFERMDGGKVISINISHDKAFTAATLGKGTHEIGMNAQPGQPAFGISNAVQGRFMIVGGGLPVQVDGVTVGGIGVSSGSPAQDQEVAQAGIDFFLEQKG